MARVRIAVLVLLGGCGPAGTLVTPDGIEPLRTMMYRVGIRDGAPELALVLSNGDLDCGLPAFFSDTNAQAEALEALLAAACREGARHVAIHLYQLDDRWLGAFEGDDDASADLLSSTVPRVGRGAYYGVDEAFLVEVDGLYRGYTASEDTWLPELGDGEIVIDDDADDLLTGWFSFPDEGLSGEFAATRCSGDTSLLDILAAQPVHYCR